MTFSILSYLFLLLLAAFIGGAVLKSFKQPPVVGYLLAGLTFGILGAGQTQDVITFLSELGVMLLLFTLGLEFSWSRLKKVARVGVYGAILQIILTTVIATPLIAGFGVSIYSAFFMAVAFSMSSTAIIVKILADRDEIDTLPGEIMVAWSVVQDLAVLPLMIILPSIGRVVTGMPFASGIFAISQDVAFAGLMLVAIFVIGKIVVPYIVDQVAKLNSRELLLIGVFAISVSGALVTQALGLSAAIGAFLAGLLISETREQHAVFSEIRPLRDLFVLLFFATLGLIIPPGFLFAHFLPVIAITLIVVSVKFIVIAALTLYLGYHAKTSFLVGIGLIEVGEFAFILARLGLSDGVISPDIYGYIISVALLSIILMPPLFISAPVLYLKIRELTKRTFPPLYVKLFAGTPDRDTFPDLPYKNHVVLCGYGRVGKYIGRALEMAGIPYVVVEYNQHKAKALREKGIEVVYGDPGDIDLLDYAQVDFARAVVIAIPDLSTQAQIITNSLTLNKNVQIYCRTHHESDQGRLKDLGVTAIIQPEFEASLTIVNKILKAFGKDADEIDGKVSRLKIEHGLG